MNGLFMAGYGGTRYGQSSPESDPEMCSYSAQLREKGVYSTSIPWYEAVCPPGPLNSMRIHGQLLQQSLELCFISNGSRRHLGELVPMLREQLHVLVIPPSIQCDW